MCFLLMCCLVQAEYDAMLLEFAGEGIPVLASSVPADKFAPFLNDLLPLIMSKAVSPDLLTTTAVLQMSYLLKPIFSTRSYPSPVM